MPDIWYGGPGKEGRGGSLSSRQMTMLALLLVVSVIGWSTPTLAQTATTVGTLTTSATFDTIWVKATFSGDSNANNSVALQYKPKTSSNWLNAYSPSMDRRSTVHGGLSNSANQNQFRAGIFGLTSGQVYDVRTTFNDVDGVIAGPTLSASITLLSPATVVRSGGTFYLDDSGSSGSGSSASPFNSFEKAFAATNCGDKLIVRSGTYAPFTFSKNCSASTWYEIEAETALGPSINNGAPRVILVSGSFVKISGLRIPNATCSGVEIGTSSHNIWLDGFKIENVGTSVVSIGHQAAYGCNGIRIDGNNHHVYIMDSTILSPTLDSKGAADPHWDTCCNGIGIEGAPSSTGVFVYKGNKITGTFRDAIGNSPEQPPGGLDNSDIINNTITNHSDDGIQIEGTDRNLLIQGNVVTSNNAFSCFAAQTGYYGPIYWLRNTCRLTATSVAGAAFKVGGLQYGFIFHNSVETMNAAHDCVSDAAGATDTSYLTVLNNIFKCQANPIYRVYSTGTRFNNNIYYRASGTIIADSWNGSSRVDLAGFQGLGQETNGKFSNPLFTDTALHIDSRSPASDAGVFLSNINDSNSLWPAFGIAPDIGKFESSGGGTSAQPPPAPQGLTVQ